MRGKIFDVFIWMVHLIITELINVLEINLVYSQSAIEYNFV